MDATDAPRIRRINVAVNAAELAAIDMLIEREEVSLTEAVRRLIEYGHFVYRAAKVDGSQVILRDEDREREVILH